MALDPGTRMHSGLELNTEIGNAAGIAGLAAEATARDAAIAVETARAEAAEALALPKAGGIMTGTITAWSRTTTEKNAIGSPAAGMVVYDSTLGKLCVYTGAAWETITSAT